MPTWYIEPRDPLIVRDGRPFGADPGARARSISFPMPSTTTGGFRNRAGLKGGVFDQSQANIDKVLATHVRGPLLAALKDDGTFHEWLPPAPADALLLQPPDDERQAAKQTKSPLVDSRLVQLVPLVRMLGTSYAQTDVALELVGPRAAVSEKPLAKPPRFWHWNTFEAWLTNPVERAQLAAALGTAGPASESRTHIAIDPLTQTAEDGRLFQTSGLEFTAQDRTRLALVVESLTPLDGFTNGGFAPLGGERRLVAWRPGAPELPICPELIRARILTERACRLVLLTPAHFTLGYRPGWLLGNHGGISASLAAALVLRSQIISGWDMAADNGPSKPRGKPRPTRRLVPAGSVYFLTLPGKEAVSDAVINKWIDAIWMQNISDDDPEDAERTRRDGFGLAALGTWNGKLTTMEV